MGTASFIGRISMELVDFLFQLALILFSTKMLGLLARKLGLPQVLGFIVAGLLIGPAIWGLIPGVKEGGLFPITAKNNFYLQGFAEIGVIFVMFSAGLETSLKDIKDTGVAAFTIALCGVMIPLGCGCGLAALFLPEATWHTWLFVGVIMTATSVGITVEVLRELGKLQTKVGTVILSAAIIDDVLGIIVLAIVLSISGDGASASPVLAAINPNNNIIISVLWILAFFVFAIVAGIGFSKLFKFIEKKTPHTRRIPILSIAVCLLYAFVAEKVFGVADITGAYVAGLVLSTNHASAAYVDRRVSIGSYMIFAPIFFASIGIKITFEAFTINILWFALAFVAVAILTKIIGCGVSSRLFGFDNKDSLKIGVGMIARGEVALIVMEKGIAGGLMTDPYRVIVVMLVLVTSLLAPILLKLLYKNDNGLPSDIPPTKVITEEGHVE